MGDTVDGQLGSDVQAKDDKRFPAAALTELGARVFAAGGSGAEEARLIAEHLVEANLIGHDSHGVIRIKKYVDWAKAGQVLPNRHVEIVGDRGAALLLDGGAASTPARSALVGGALTVLPHPARRR